MPAFWCASAVVALLAGSAFAQAPGIAPPQRQSLLGILFEGMEAPGYVILLMSIAAVSLIVDHFWHVRMSRLMPEDEMIIARNLVETRRVRDCYDRLSNHGSMFARALCAGLRHARHGFDAMFQATQDKSAELTSRMSRRVEYLNIIGNLGVLLGLLGTVLGMIDAFAAMHAAHGAAKPEDLAHGISLALVNTFLGLTVAIVSLGFFGVCRNRVDSLTMSVAVAALDVLESLRTATVVAQAQAAKAAAEKNDQAVQSSSEASAPAPASTPYSSS
jgi:biopolymer transport protein ExbB